MIGIRNEGNLKILKGGRLNRGRDCRLLEYSLIPINESKKEELD
jgi:hypothetical protein